VTLISNLADWKESQTLVIFEKKKKIVGLTSSFERARYHSEFSRQISSWIDPRFKSDPRAHTSPEAISQRCARCLWIECKFAMMHDGGIWNVATVPSQFPQLKEFGVITLAIIAPPPPQRVSLGPHLSATRLAALIFVFFLLSFVSFFLSRSSISMQPLHPSILCQCCNTVTGDW